MKKKRVWKRIILSSASLLLFGVAVGVLTLWYFSKDLPTFDQIVSRQVPQSTKIYDRTGEILLYEISGGQKRTSISFQDIPKHLKDATVAIEDENFYTEPGVSIKGIIRALLKNITSGEIVQGGSTITQQLARNAFLSLEQTIARKIKEVLLAIQLNRYYSKDEILSLYLNEIPYGSTIYGAEAASQAYFNKPAKNLTLAESSILAAIPKAPSYYSPWGTHQKELLERSHLVLKKMRELEKITEEELSRAIKEKVEFSVQDYRGIKAPHFVLAVQDYLVQKYGDAMVRSGGLEVKTTLDWKMQEIAEIAVSEGAKKNEELYSGKNAALISEDPKTGQILALVGSRDYFDTENEGNFNVATQGLRQPGSALKPFVYMAAFEKGLTPETVIFDVPTEFDSTGNPEKSYRPENFDNIFRGPVSLRNALAQSVNIPAVKILYLVGINEAIEFMNRFGISTLTDPRRYGLSLVLGGGEVRLIEMAKAYSVLAREGISLPQTMILEVKNSKGEILEKFEELEGEKIIDPQYPRLINDILSDVDARARLYQGSLNLTTVPNRDVALKTGTSNDYRDAWVFGYTPNLVTGVWAGNNDNSPMQRKGSSILAALPIWHAFAEKVLPTTTFESFQKPNPITTLKPILNGDYLANRLIHNILFYVNKNDPLGPFPINPEADPQFTNWETGVLEWASKNIPDFQTYNLPGSKPSSASLQNPYQKHSAIEIQSPAPGTFVNSPIDIRAELSQPTEIAEILIYLNSQVVQRVSHSSFNPLFVWSLLPQNLSPQNLLEIEIVNKDGQKSKSGVIFYH